MRGLKRKDGKICYRDVCSVLLISCMVLSGITVILPLTAPYAQGVDHGGGSCAAEDGDPILDEDGTPNGIVLWTANNNPHNVTGNYIIEPWMTLIISSINGPVLVNFQAGVEMEVQGVLQASGAPGNKIWFMNMTTQPAQWSGIRFSSGSGSFQYCNFTNAEYAVRVQSDQPVLIDRSEFKINQDGVLAEGMGGIIPNPVITNSSFYDNFNPAIILQDSNALIFNNTIKGGNGYLPYGVYNGGSGIRVTTNGGSSAKINIMNNTIYGGHGINDPGSFNGARGGNAISLSGNVDLTVITNNTLFGGSAGDDTDGTGDASEAGHGIYASNHAGSIELIDAKRIGGGYGGNNTQDVGEAGRGGMGIYISPIPDTPYSTKIEGNDIITGGHGGNNKAIMDGNAGDGGAAIMMEDDPVISGGNVKVIFNNVIQGGDGGDNSANWNVNGWSTGEGGQGILLRNYRPFSVLPTTITIDDNLGITGGKGGGNSGIGILPLANISDGGAGIVIMNCTNVFIHRSTITGGEGGDNNLVVPMVNLAIPGGGGNGIIAYTQNPGVDLSELYVEICDIIGGVGGANNSDTFAPGDSAGEGGMGLLFYGSTGTCTLSHIIGGQGGANYGAGGVGGEGGNGFVSFLDSFSINVNNGTIIGGKGGFNAHSFGGGGGGGVAVFAASTTGLTISDNHLIAGGDGGNDNALGGGALGAGDASFSSIYADSRNGWVSDVIVHHNYITVGRGGTGLGAKGEDGDACIFGMGLVLSTLTTNYIVNNNIASDNLTGGTVGIFLRAVDSVWISDNDIHNNTNGIRYEDGGVGGFVTISSNEIYNRIATAGTGIFIAGGVSIIFNNNVSDFEYGIWTQGAGIYVLDDDRIRDCNSFGVIADNSNPMVYNSNISNSGNVGMYFIGSTTSKIYSTTILDSAGANCWVSGGSMPQFFNCTITTSGPWDFYVDGNSHPWLLNTTFGKKPKTHFVDFSSNLTVNWFMHVRAQDMGGSPVVGAEVWVNDTWGDPHPPSGNPSITDANGQANWIVVPEYIDRNGGDTEFNDYDVIAYLGPKYGTANPTMDISKEVFIILDCYKLDIPLKQGWNMISLPQNRSNEDLVDTLSDIDGNYRAVRAFNSSDVLDPWKQYLVDKVSGPLDPTNDLRGITNHKGLWIYLNTSDVLDARGKIPVPSTTAIQLNKGWNFVGYPSIVERPVGFGAGDAFQGLSGIIRIVWYYNASSSSGWKWEGWDDPGTHSPDTINYIRPGEGYWVYANQPSLWLVDWE